MNGSLRKQCAGLQKAIDASTKSVTMIVSDASIDRDEEIILPSAFSKRLEVYRSNPIVLWGHALSARESPPEHLIGKTTEIEVTPDGLLATMQLATDRNPTAALIWELIEGKYLRAVSIGAGIHDRVSWYEAPETIQEKLRGNGDPHALAAARALLDFSASAVLTDLELWEISWVYAGSNRNALARALEEGSVARSTLKRLQQWEQGHQHLVQPVTRQIQCEPEVAAKEPPLEAEIDPEEAELAALMESDPEAKEALVDLLASLILERED